MTQEFSLDEKKNNLTSVLHSFQLLFKLISLLECLRK